MYTILCERNGVSLVCGDDYRLTAYVNGNYYRVNDGRPLNGVGRQLREDTRKTIADLLPIAETAANGLRKANEERIARVAAEAAEKASQTPRVNFADALQDAFLKTLTEKASVDMSEQIYPVVEKMLVDKFGIVPIAHEIRIPERKPWETTEVLHKDFDRILSMLLDNESVYLCGPAGTGKSYLAQQLASALELEYYYTNSVTDDVQIKGFVDANGNYHGTQFYDAFTKGGVFLLDELDASIPETLVLLNNALANGYFAFPNGKAKAHPDFHCIAAGNTFGTGADETYIGRYALDGSSMDRFAMIMVDYDERIEKAMANGDEELVAFAHDFRQAVKKTGCSCLCTYRAIKRLAKFSAYMDKRDALRIGLLKGLAADDAALIARNMTSHNGWTACLNDIAKA